MINGMLAKRVAKPTRIKTEHNTSVNTAKHNDTSELILITDGNWIGSPEKSIINFGIPCDNMSPAMKTLAINNAMCIELED